MNILSKIDNYLNEADRNVMIYQIADVYDTVGVKNKELAKLTKELKPHIKNGDVITALGKLSKERLLYWFKLTNKIKG